MAATAGGRVGAWGCGGEGTWNLVKMETRALQLAICTSPIIYLVCPVKFCINIVFYFSWEHCNTQEKSITKVMQRFGWQTRCIIGDVQMVNMVIRRDRKDCSKLSLKLRKWNRSNNSPEQCWELLANNVASVWTGLKVWPVSNFARQLPTTRNRVCKQTQHVTTLLGLLVNNVASVCT